MRTSTFFGAKNFIFLEIYGVSARSRGVEPVGLRQFSDKGNIFRDFVRTSKC